MSEEKARVVCEGEGPFNGHPRVFLDISKTGHAVCPYCSKHFEQAHPS
jgi:uncharacterized Zn-finger protein